MDLSFGWGSFRKNFVSHAFKKIEIGSLVLNIIKVIKKMVDASNMLCIRILRIMNIYQRVFFVCSR